MEFIKQKQKTNLLFQIFFEIYVPLYTTEGRNGCIYSMHGRIK